MYYIVTKIDSDDDGGLLLTDEVKVSVSLLSAVERIGAWKGDMFAVWECEDRPNPQEVEAVMHRAKADSIHVLGCGSFLYPLDPSLVRQLHQPAATS